MTEIEKLQAELAAVERELADANAAADAIKAGEKPAKIRRAPKPKAKPKAKPKPKPNAETHRPGFHGSIEGHGGPAPVGDRFRSNHTPVVTKQFDPTDRPTDYTYEARECLLLAAVEAGSILTGIRCGCASCNNK